MISFFNAKVPWWAAGLSIYATIISSVTFLTIPAKVYATDWTYYPMLLTIPVVGMLVSRYFLPYFLNHNLQSPYELLETRFNLPTRLAASALFALYLLARLALVLYLPSLVVNVITGFPMLLCIIILGLLTALYSAWGGIKAVVWADAVQGLILIGGALFCAVYLIIYTIGGTESFWSIACEGNKLRLFDMSMSYTRATWWVIIISGLTGNLITYTSDQTILLRYMAAGSQTKASRSIQLHAWLYIFSSIAFYCIGTGLYTFYYSRGSLPEVANDGIFPYFISHELSPLFAAVVILALLSASMSTVSSNINSIANAISVDFIKRLIPDTKESTLVLIGRLITVLSALVGILLASLMTTWHIESLLDYFNTIIGLLTTGLGSLFIIAAFMPKIKAHAALTGFLLGEIGVFMCFLLTDINFFLYSTVGLSISLITAKIISSFSNDKEKVS